MKQGRLAAVSTTDRAKTPSCTPSGATVPGSYSCSGQSPAAPSAVVLSSRVIRRLGELHQLKRFFLFTAFLTLLITCLDVIVNQSPRE